MDVDLIILISATQLYSNWQVIMISVAFPKYKSSFLKTCFDMRAGA